jgi:hypothetical protein
MPFMETLSAGEVMAGMPADRWFLHYKWAVLPESEA